MLNVQVTEVSVHAVLDCSSVMRWMVAQDPLDHLVFLYTCY